MNYTLFSRSDCFSDQLCDKIYSRLQSQDRFIFNDQNPELVICVGGDGTLLRAIHKYLDHLEGILFVGIHTGTLGFFTDYTADEVDQFLEDMQKEPFRIDKCHLLEIRTDDSLQAHYALNEFRLGDFLKTVSYDIFIDGEFFERTNGSGVCVSTQAGSTAINRALMGAVIDDGLSVLQLAEIMPICHKSHHSLRNPYIMRSDRTITIQGKSISESSACTDHKTIPVENASKIEVRTSDKVVRFARFRPYSYLKRLKNLY